VTEVAVYVLVHGGGHGGWCYQPVARMLRAAGHEVYAPTLTGLGERSHLLGPEIDLDTHIRDITAVLRYEDLRDVILVGHSYGGMVITGAAGRAAERIGRLVYLDSIAPGDGESLFDLATDLMQAARSFGQTVDGVELVLLPFPGSGAFYGVTDPAALTWMDERLTAQPWRCFEQPVRIEDPAALAAIPQFHIVCTSTLATRDQDQVEAARAAGRLWDIDTGHDLMITEPRAVADRLLEIATITV
jgi:pimeloyl-ACP methyl ester carboxylesterase